MQTGKKRIDVSSATLHIIAMASMLLDHSVKAFVKTDTIFAVLGRLAFPIFAFMVVEGFLHTRSYGKYVLRMFIFAVISEVPYDLMKSQSLFDRYDQNVMVTFLIALLLLKVIDLVKSKGKIWAYVLVSVAVSIVGLFLGFWINGDYGGFGILTVFVFYFFHERKWWTMLLQFICLSLINVLFIGAFQGNFDLPGLGLEIPVQGFALLALIPIWMYHGRQGHHSKPFQYFCYAFYPLHMLIIALISRLLAS
jgi:hypothetical protein